MTNWLSKYRLILVIILILLIGFGYYFFTNRHPNTSDAFVTANVRPVSPQVSGYLQAVYVKNNETVKKGQKLFLIDPAPFQIALKKANAELKFAQKKLGLLKIQITGDKDNITSAQYALKSAKSNYERSAKIAKSGAITASKLEQLEDTLGQAQAAFDLAQNKLLLDQTQLTISTGNIATYKLTVQQAQLNLNETVVKAVSNGVVTNLHMATGTYVGVGHPVCAFVDTEHWFVQANLKETDLGHVRNGQKVKIVLSLYPGHPFKGTVLGSGSVDRRTTNPNSFLQEVVKENEWILLPQRIPVQISIDNPSKKYPLHVGASASVTIYDGGKV